MFSVPHALRIPFPALALLSLGLFGGCIFSEKEGKTAVTLGSGDGAEAVLVLRKAALAGSSIASAAAIDSIHIRVTGNGMDPKEFGFAGTAFTLNLVGIPPGTGRTVAASLFRQGRLLYLGQALADFTKEARVEINLRCEPQFSRVVARFHIPPTLPLKVADGNLILTGPTGEFRARLVRAGEFGSFTLDEVPGAARYDVSLSLVDAAGRPVYESRQDGLLLPLGEEARWDLVLTASDAIAGLVLTLPEPRTALVGARFPSRLRSPGAAGEIILSEFYASPSAQDSGSEGEWWELFNRTADSLSLAGCRLTRTRTGSGATQSYAFDSAQRIAPGKALSFGRAAAPTEVHYADFSLVNTSSPLLLLCAADGLLLDSLRYSSTVSDSLAVTIRDGQVSGLNPDSLGRAFSKGSWCLTRMGEMASPGAMGACPI